MQADERPSIVVKHEPNLSQEDEIPAEQREAYPTNTLQHQLLKQQQQQGGAQQIIVMQPPSSIHQHNIINSALAVQANNGASSSMVAAEGQDYGAGASYVNLPTIAAATTPNVMECEYEEMNMRDKEELREQDRFLPIANVARIMKKAIPDSGKIAKDAKECVQECLSEFISFITSEASERCQQEKRKTINGEDILFAMTTLGFDNYVDPLKIYLAKYRESMKGEKLLTMGEYGAVEAIEDSSINHSLQYQVGGNTIHATMVNGAYSQNKVLELQNLHPNLHFST